LKRPQRLDESRLLEALQERGLVDSALVAEHEGEGSVIRALVFEGAVGDWDLSRVVSEVFHLPFLPVDLAQPDLEILRSLPSEALLAHGLVPICRQGNLLTVAMPGMVEAQALAEVGEETGMRVAPVVGTVLTNSRWLEENSNPGAPDGAPTEEPVALELNEGEAEWGSLFDEGDAAVQSVLDDELGQEPNPPSISPAKPTEDAGEGSDAILPPSPEFG